MSCAPFELAVRVYMEDTDTGGIVYYVNYLKYLERARTELMRSLGYGKEFICNFDLMFVVRDVAVHYRRPARLDDQLVATAQLAELRGASMVFRQEVRRGSDVLADGEVRVACVDRDGVKPRRIPAALLASLRALI